MAYGTTIAPDADMSCRSSRVENWRVCCCVVCGILDRDVMSNEEVGDMVHLMRSAQEAASLLVECAYSRGSADNITVMIIDVLRAQQAVVQGRPRGVGGNGLVGGGSGGNGGGGGIGGDGTGANGGLDDDSNGDPGGVLGDLHGAGAGLGAGSAVMVDDHYASSGREHEL